MYNVYIYVCFRYLIFCLSISATFGKEWGPA